MENITELVWIVVTVVTVSVLSFGIAYAGGLAAGRRRNAAEIQEAWSLYFRELDRRVRGEADFARWRASTDAARWKEKLVQERHPAGDGGKVGLTDDGGISVDEIVAAWTVAIVEAANHGGQSDVVRFARKVEKLATAALQAKLAAETAKVVYWQANARETVKHGRKSADAWKAKWIETGKLLEAAKIERDALAVRLAAATAVLERARWALDHWSSCDLDREIDKIDAALREATDAAENATQREMIDG